MKFLSVAAIFSLLSVVCGALEDFSENHPSREVEIVPAFSTLTANEVPPIIVPTFMPPLNQPCPNYCNNAPSFCNNNCIYGGSSGGGVIKTIKVPIQVAKKVAKTNTRMVAKEKVTVTVNIEVDYEVVCPLNFQRVNNECISAPGELKTCHPPYKWNNKLCVATTKVCPNDFTKNNNECIERIVCPHNYILRGDECVPPLPTCSLGYFWNGRTCKLQVINCAPGFTLENGNECVHETIGPCPPNHILIGNQCVREPPKCPTGFLKDDAANTCRRQITKCPSESYEQHGQCYVVKYSCPAGSTPAGEVCSIRETINTIEYEM
jgi:hypothetical protein